MGAPCPIITRDLSVGSSGSDVMQLQQMLQGMGFLNASSTGYFGALTAQALTRFQGHFGISSSTAGFLGPITQNFLRMRCGGNGQGRGQGQDSMGSSTQSWMWQNGSSTPPMPPHPSWQNGSSTIPCGMPYRPESDDMNYGSASTNIIVMHPCGGMATSTPGMPMPQPCQQNAQPDVASSSWNQSASVEAALFVPHTFIPGDDNGPCHGMMMNPTQQNGGQGGGSMAPMIPAGQ